MASYVSFRSTAGLSPSRGPPADRPHSTQSRGGPRRQQRASSRPSSRPLRPPIPPRVSESFTTLKCLIRVSGGAILSVSHPSTGEISPNSTVCLSVLRRYLLTFNQTSRLIESGGNTPGAGAFYGRGGGRTGGTPVSVSENFTRGRPSCPLRPKAVAHSSFKLLICMVHEQVESHRLGSGTKHASGAMGPESSAGALRFGALVYAHPNKV